ncbi:MAG TPA: hypothetical protein DEO88_12510 [Syntrophobacteraceae bacterium]|nr:hypothetical protein [Syntrophobacteraceae bacterium]
MKSRVFFCAWIWLLPPLYSGFATPGELLITQINSPTVPMAIHVAQVNGTHAWTWINGQIQSLASLYSYDTTGITGLFGFDAPKDPNSGAGGVIPWGLHVFTLTLESTGAHLSFTLDLRDEAWSQGSTYSSPDTYVYVDWGQGKVYLAHESQHSSSDPQIQNQVVAIWAFWSIGDGERIHQNFRAPLVLKNEVGTATAGGSLHVEGEIFSSSDSARQVRVLSEDTSGVDIGTNDQVLSFQGTSYKHYAWNSTPSDIRITRRMALNPNIASQIAHFGTYAMPTLEPPWMA